MNAADLAHLANVVAKGTEITEEIGAIERSQAWLAKHSDAIVSFFGYRIISSKEAFGEGRPECSFNHIRINLPDQRQLYVALLEHRLLVLKQQLADL